MFLENNVVATLRHVTFLENVASLDGGAIAVLGDAQMFLRGLVTLNLNRAHYRGGAIYLGPVASDGDVTVTVDNLEMHDNRVENGRGGAIFSSRPLLCNAVGTSILHRNWAAKDGGAVALLEAVMQLKEGHSFVATYNSAGVSGGAFALLSGAWISVEDEVCAAECNAILRGDGVCNPACLSRACNWDNGDCFDRFQSAGHDLTQTCKRTEGKGQCAVSSQYSATSNCAANCFTASCDFSKKSCAGPKSRLKKCPILDATVYSSLNQASEVMSYLSGGTSQEYGVCKNSTCQQPSPSPHARSMAGSGRVGNASLAIEDQDPWLNLRGLDVALSQVSRANLTVEMWAKVGRISLPHKKVDFGIFGKSITEQDVIGWISPLGFILAGSNFAMGILTDKALPGNSAWPLVFAGTPPTTTCSDRRLVLDASTGVIGDGPDMIPRSVKLDCSWIISPTGARSVTLIFTEFLLLQGQHVVEVCTCASTACQEPGNQTTGGSHCREFSGGIVPLPYTSLTGVMRVVVKNYVGSFRTNPGFTAAYAAAFDADRIDKDSWHHLAVTVESQSQCVSFEYAHGLH